MVVNSLITHEISKLELGKSCYKVTGNPIVVYYLPQL